METQEPKRSSPERVAIPHAMWLAEAERRFGKDPLRWRFVCPSCGHVASVQDYKDVGAPVECVGFSCIGRWLKNPDGTAKKVKDMCERPGPCNYAGGGLFRINPVHVEKDGQVHDVFNFAPSVEEEKSDGSNEGSAGRTAGR